MSLLTPAAVLTAIVGLVLLLAPKFGHLFRHLGRGTDMSIGSPDEHEPLG